MLTNHLSLRQMGVLLAVTPVLLSLGMIALLSMLILDAENDYDRQIKSNDLVTKLYIAEQQMAASIFQVVAKINSQDPDFGQNCDRIERKLAFSKKGLNQWIKERPEETETIRAGQELCDEGIKLVRLAKTVYEDKTIPPLKRAKHLRRPLQSILIRAQSRLSELTRFEESVTLNTSDVLFMGNPWLWVCLAGGLGVSFSLALALVLVFNGSISQRLAEIQDSAQRLAAGQPVENVLSGSDELAQLSGVLVESSAKLEAVKARELRVLSDASEVLCSLDSSLRFVAVGESATRLWGVQATQLIASPVASIVARADRKAAVSCFQAAMEENREKRFETRIRKPEGGNVSTMWTVNRDVESGLLYCVARDVSERAELERLKKRFLATVSHDLRAPLTSITHSLNLLSDGDRGTLSERVTGMLDKGKNSVARLLRLVEELLDIDKLESGKLTVEPTFVSSYDVCVEASEAVEWYASSRNIAIVHELSDVALLGDERRLIQVVINLLSNALKFSPEGSTVKLSCRRAGDFGEISVADEGPGVAEDERQSIFQKFAQAKDSPKTSMKGTGLGLSIASAIMDAHDGEIGVDSLTGSGPGSRFWIRVPLFPEEDVDE